MNEYQIVELVKDWYRATSIKAVRNFLLNDTTIISYKSYEHSYQLNPSISKQVIGYVDNDITNYVSTLEFPLLQRDFISYVYLYKKGYLIRGYSPLGPAPLPNLKYIIHCITNNTGLRHYEFKDKLVIELVDMYVVANNLNLPNIVSSVLGSKSLSENEINLHEFDEIDDRTSSQKLFAGRTLDVASLIVSRYFDTNERELSKEVFKISEAYERVFRPYRVVYDTKTWQPVLM